MRLLARRRRFAPSPRLRLRPAGRRRRPAFGHAQLGDRGLGRARPRPARDQPPLGQQPLDDRPHRRSRDAAGAERGPARRRRRPGPLPHRPRRRHARLRRRGPPRPRHRRLHLPARRALSRRPSPSAASAGRAATSNSRWRCTISASPISTSSGRQRYDTPTAAELAQAGNHGVTLDYLRGMAGHGYRVGRLSALIRMRDHGVTPDYIAALARHDVRDIPPDDVVRLRDHGVQAEFVGELRQLGYRRLAGRRDDPAARSRRHRRLYPDPGRRTASATSRPPS